MYIIQYFLLRIPPLCFGFATYHCTILLYKPLVGGGCTSPSYPYDLLSHFDVLRVRRSQTWYDSLIDLDPIGPNRVEYRNAALPGVSRGFCYHGRNLYTLVRNIALYW